MNTLSQEECQEKVKISEDREGEQGPAFGGASFWAAPGVSRAVGGMGFLK